MEVFEALQVLGATRVIWIDDCFNDTPAQLAELLTNGLEIAKSCNFPELTDALEIYEYDPGNGVASVTQILTDLPTKRRAEIKERFFEAEVDKENFATDELSASSIELACDLLGVAKADRWTFDKAERNLAALCREGDAHLSYVVDLNETGGSETRGLDILRKLWVEKSKGTAFILTHETDIEGEGRIEISLRDKLEDLDGLGLPICVIAKQRLYQDPDDPDAMAEALRTGIKRAGLRRSLHQVLIHARKTFQDAIDNAAELLLSVPPEKLESHVFERGYKEGVSELHVVERAITAHIGQKAREFFGVNQEVLSSIKRLRALRSIILKPGELSPDPQLAAFREAEVWESEDLLNGALTPIACGDVFELDTEEAATKTSNKKFVLLGQPCDISLRPDEKKRAQDTAFFIPIRRRNSSGKSDPKAPLLPFTLRGEQWACDFRGGGTIKLSILDLASFRTDGRVRIDNGHKSPSDMLVGQQNVYSDRTSAPTKALEEVLGSLANMAMSLETNPPAAEEEKAIVNRITNQFSLQLTFSSEDAFKYIHTATFEKDTKIKAMGQITERPARITWRLRRCGRIRMPYAAALLDQYTTVMSRHAFDLDYMSSVGGDFSTNTSSSEIVSNGGAVFEPKIEEGLRPKPKDTQRER